MNASASRRHCFDGLACRPPDRLAWSHGGCIPCGAILANHNSDLLLANDRDDHSNGTNPRFWRDSPQRHHIFTLLTYGLIGWSSIHQEIWIMPLKWFQDKLCKWVQVAAHTTSTMWFWEPTAVETSRPIRISNSTISVILIVSNRTIEDKTY